MVWEISNDYGSSGPTTLKYFDELFTGVAPSLEAVTLWVPDTGSILEHRITFIKSIQSSTIQYLRLACLSFV